MVTRNYLICDLVSTACCIFVQKFNMLILVIVPDPPIIIYFPEVTYSLAQIVWEPPTEPNGVITGYRVSYRERNATENQAVVNDTLGASTREYTVRGLRRMTYYLFSVSAKTQLGWGESSSVMVLTMINRGKKHKRFQVFSACGWIIYTTLH